MLISVSLSAHPFYWGRRGEGHLFLTIFVLHPTKKKVHPPPKSGDTMSCGWVGMLKAGQEVAEQHNVSVETRCLVGFLLFMLFTLQVFFCVLSVSYFLLFITTTNTTTVDTQQWHVNVLLVGVSFFCWLLMLLVGRVRVCVCEHRSIQFGKLGKWKCIRVPGDFSSPGEDGWVFSIPVKRICCIYWKFWEVLGGVWR